MICPFCTDSNVTPFDGTKFLYCDECGLFIRNVSSSKSGLKIKNRGFLLSTCRRENPGEDRIKDANEQQLDVLEKHISPGIVYDVGAAAGFFMKAARDRGWKVHGNEISERAIGWAKSNYAISIDYGFLEDLDVPTNYFDAVVMWNILEHTFNPRITIEVCKKMLKSGGLIFIRVPNKRTKEELIRFYTGGHLFEFTEKCLMGHLEAMGFKCVERNAGHNPKSGVPHCDYLYRNG